MYVNIEVNVPMWFIHGGTEISNGHSFVRCTRQGLRKLMAALSKVKVTELLKLTFESTNRNAPMINQTTETIFQTGPFI